MSNLHCYINEGNLSPTAQNQADIAMGRGSPCEEKRRLGQREDAVSHIFRGHPCPGKRHEAIPNRVTKTKTKRWFGFCFGKFVVLTHPKS